MFYIKGTHFGAGPSSGMKKHPIFGSSMAAKIIPLSGTIENLAILLSGSILVKKLP